MKHNGWHNKWHIGTMKHNAWHKETSISFDFSRSHGTICSMSSVVPTLPETLAAVEVLVRAGVSDESVGRAVREWLMHPRSPSSPVTPASTQSGEGAHPVASLVPPSLPEPVPEAPARKFEFVKVRFSEGAATNIAIPTALFLLLVERWGGEKEARGVARALAKEAPLDVDNRSAWVTQRLTAGLTSGLSA
jgi:hypothetical protein